MVLRRDLNYKLCQIEQVRLIGQMLGQDLDGGDTVQLSVAGLVHFAHPACANQRGDLVGPESCARLDRKSPPNWECELYAVRPVLGSIKRVASGQLHVSELARKSDEWVRQYICHLGGGDI